MSTKHLVDRELVGLLDVFPTVTVSAETLPDMRARGLPIPVDPEHIAATEAEVRMIPGPEGATDVALTIYRPRNASGTLPCIFHIHGGGYVGGSVAQFEGLSRAAVAQLGCVMTSVEYRLAPETPFPGPVEDCYAALGYVFNNAKALGIDATRIGVMGESAGGGLAAALALLARDRGAYALAFQHLIYPMLDDRTVTAKDPHPHTGEFIWNAQSNAFGWASLLGVAPGSDGVSPYAAAARAEDLSRLPPTYISTGALDLFLEEDLEYARRLMRAGVAVELHVYPGAFHGFEILPISRVSSAAIAASRGALKAALFPA